MITQIQQLTNTKKISNTDELVQHFLDFTSTNLFQSKEEVAKEPVEGNFEMNQGVKKQDWLRPVSRLL